MMGISSIRRRLADPEERALRGLAKLTSRAQPARPVDALEAIADLARELTKARYGALVVIDERDNVEGFVVSGLTNDEGRRLKAPPQGHGPLGNMRQDGLAVRINNLADYEKAFGFPPKHPEMTTLMGVPVWAEGSVRGALYVTDRKGGRPFRDADEVILKVLAGHAGRVVESSWY